MPISDKLKASVEQNVNRQNFQTEKIAHRPRPFNAPLEVQDKLEAANDAVVGKSLIRPPSRSKKDEGSVTERGAARDSITSSSAISARALWLLVCDDVQSFNFDSV